ncbi:uncharacterized protein LOC141860749 [Acropora palmata]|uniref:uncharacterized protein LOC141860749 n=1 Tax=Acropora palmata TaxID=6131 RepID=UPI003D9FC7B0
MLHTTRNEKLLTSYVLILYLILTIGPEQTSGNHQIHEKKAEDISTSPLKTTTALKSMNPTVNSKSIGEKEQNFRNSAQTKHKPNDHDKTTVSGQEGSSTVTQPQSSTVKINKGRSKIRWASDKIKNLNVTYKDSLKNAVTIIQDLFKYLKVTVVPTKGIKSQEVNKENPTAANQTDTNDGKGTVNVLVATERLESFALEYAKTHLKKNESIIFDKENFEMKIQRLATNRTEPLVYSGNKTAHESEKDCVRLELPPEVLKGKDIAISIIYYDISQFVPECPALKLQKRIIAAKVHPPPEGNLQENVTISFGRDKKEVDKPHCMFWNFTIKSAFNGSWSRKGCSLVKSDDNETICTCNHLTNFAILMQVGKLEDENNIAVSLDLFGYSESDSRNQNFNCS